MRETNEALLSINRVLEIDNTHAKAWHLRGLILGSTNHSLALESFEAAFKFDPKLIEPLYDAAVVLSGMERYQESIEKLDLVLKENPAHFQ